MALVVFTGGARSGKSSAAQALAVARAADVPEVVVAVFGDGDGDSEFSGRIERHRAERPADWHTIEAAESLAWLAAVPAGALLLVDCLGTLAGRCMAEVWDEAALAVEFVDANEPPAGYEADCVRRLDLAIEALLARTGDTIVVTNEVGDGVIPAYATGRVFRDLLGRANRRLVDEADAAFLCVAGRVFDLAALPRSVSRWPDD